MHPESIHKTSAATPVFIAWFPFDRHLRSACARFAVTP